MRRIKQEVTQEYLREIFDYDPITGIVTRRKTLCGRALQGAVVGTLDHKGYLRVGVKGRYYYLHVLIWLYVYGKWPVGQLDHDNLVKSENYLLNLREATPTQNKCNQGLRCDNKSGVKGVSLDKRTGRWRADVAYNRVRRTIGFFSTVEAAAAARAQAALELHGEFARETTN